MDEKALWEITVKVLGKDIPEAGKVVELNDAKQAQELMTGLNKLLNDDSSHKFYWAGIHDALKWVGIGSLLTGGALITYGLVKKHKSNRKNVD